MAGCERVRTNWRTTRSAPPLEQRWQAGTDAPGPAKPSLILGRMQTVAAIRPHRNGPSLSDEGPFSDRTRPYVSNLVRLMSPKVVGILAYEGVGTLDFTGPLHALQTAESLKE